MNTNAKPDLSGHSGRSLLWLGGCLCALTFFMLASVLNRPSMFSYQNWDDAYYNSIAVQYASTGEWRPASLQPLGVAKTEKFFAGNPILTPYLTALFIKGFGPDRWVFRLASLGAFVAAGLALNWTVYLLALPRIQGFLVLFTYYACPWLYYVMNTSRAEPLSIASLYLAVLAVALYLKFPKGRYSSVWLLLSRISGRDFSLEQSSFLRVGSFRHVALLFSLTKTKNPPNEECSSG